MLKLIIHTAVVLALILWEVKNTELRYISFKDFFAERGSDGEQNYAFVILIALGLIKIVLILLASYLI